MLTIAKASRYHACVYSRPMPKSLSLQYIETGEESKWARGVANDVYSYAHSKPTRPAPSMIISSIKPKK